MNIRKTRVLILEDDYQLATACTSYLKKKGYELIYAKSVEEAIDLYPSLQADICLININSHGKKTGIDFAHFLRAQLNPLPFIYLSSELNLRKIQQAKETFPAGFLTKAIQKESLFTTIEIALHNSRSKKEKEAILEIDNGTKVFHIPLKSIKYIQADHVYVKIKIEGGRPIFKRSPLKELLDQLPAERFVQTHRSFVINLDQVSRWDKQNIYLDKESIPISRSRKKKIYERLKMG